MNDKTLQRLLTETDRLWQQEPVACVSLTALRQRSHHQRKQRMVIGSVAAVTCAGSVMLAISLSGISFVRPDGPRSGYQEPALATPTVRLQELRAQIRVWDDFRESLDCAEYVFCPPPAIPRSCL